MPSIGTSFISISPISLFVLSLVVGCVAIGRCIAMEMNYERGTIDEVTSALWKGLRSLIA